MLPAGTAVCSWRCKCATLHSVHCKRCRINRRSVSWNSYAQPFHENQFTTSSVHTVAGEKLGTVSGSRSSSKVKYSDLYLSFHSQLTSWSKSEISRCLENARNPLFVSLFPFFFLSKERVFCQKRKPKKSICQKQIIDRNESCYWPISTIVVRLICKELNCCFIFCRYKWR